LKFRVGQIGVGNWGKFHCKLLAQMTDIVFAGVYHIQGSTGNVEITEFQDLDSILSDVHAVVITASTDNHYRLAKIALEKNLHVFVEKPICLNLGEADELVRMAGKRDLILQVGHIERFNPAYIAVRKLGVLPEHLQVKRVGSYTPRQRNVSVIHDLMIHDLDLVVDLVGATPIKIEAYGKSFSSGKIDYCSARIEFTNGSVAELESSRISSEKVRKMQLIANNGRYDIDFARYSARLSQFTKDDNDSVSVSESELIASARENINPLRDELSAFITSAQNNIQPLVDGSAGRAALELAQAVERSIVLKSN